MFENFYHSKYFEEYAVFFVPHQRYYMRAVEAVETMHILRSGLMDSHADFLADHAVGDFMKIRFETKVKDLENADLSRVKKVVMVGSGPLPETILFLNENFSIPEIIGIDNNEEAVLFGSELLSYLGVGNASIDYADGVVYDYTDVDFVYIASFVPPKNKVLDQIARTAPDHVQIVVETPLLMNKMLFEEVTSQKLHPRLKIIKRGLNETDYFRHEILTIEKYST